MEYQITGAESTPKQDFLTQKLSLENTVFVHRRSHLPIPIENAIRTEILCSFEYTYLKRSQLSSFFTHTFFSQYIKSLIFGSNNDAAENQMVGSKSPSYGLVYPA